MKTYFLPTLFMLLVLTLCCKKVVKEIEIDNPSDQKIILVLDETETIEIEAGERKRIPITYGERKININDTTESITLDADHDYLLNPAKETYYIQKLKYFASPKAEKKYYDDHYEERSEVEGFEVSGDYQKVEGLLIRKTWDFDLDEEIDMSLRVKTQPRKGHITLSKIHRSKDLMSQIHQEVSKFLQENYVDEGEE